MTEMKLLLIAQLIFLSACAFGEKPTIIDEFVIEDQVGRVEGYVRSDGAITDSVGRVKAYIE